MICVETIGKVRRDHDVFGKGIKEICRTRGLSRGTVRKILRSEETSFNYDRQKQPYPRLGLWIDRLEEMLLENEKRPKKERFRGTRIWDDLRREGYDGSYDSVRRYIRVWRDRHHRSSDAFVPLIFAPGEAYQFDWSEETILLAGTLTKVKVAHFRLSHSRMSFSVAYPRETQEMVFEAHDKAFAFFGGGCQRGIYDNMSTAVDAILVGKERRFNKAFLQMCSHHLIEPSACSPASGWEKGQVENLVKETREVSFKPRPAMDSLAELNAQLLRDSIDRAKRASHPEHPELSVWDMFERERPFLTRSQGPFTGFREKTVAVSRTCLISFDRNKYSVEARAVGHPAQVEAYATRIVIRQDGEIVGEHERSFSRGQTLFNPWHYVPVLQRKPGALRNGAPFKDWDLPPAIARVWKRLADVSDGDQQMVSILYAAYEHGLDVAEEACAEALSSGLRSAEAILNIISRRTSPPPPEAIEPPVHLKLTVEPIADCARYDRLGGVDAAA